MASIRSRLDRLRERIPDRARARAQARLDEASRARQDALGVLARAVLDHGAEVDPDDEFSLAGIRLRLAKGEPSPEDEALLAALPADALAAVGLSALRFVELMGAQFDTLQGRSTPPVARAAPHRARWGFTLASKG